MAEEAYRDALVNRTDGGVNAISTGSLPLGIESEERLADGLAYCYEFAVLLDTVDQLLDVTGKPVPNVRRLNAFLEANLVHARVLTSFFFPTKKLKTDITAQDFLGEAMDRDNPEARRL